MQIGIRALEISKRLIDKDVIPIVLTKKIYKKDKLNINLAKEIPPVIEIVRTNFLDLSSRVSPIFSSFFKPGKYLEWVPFAYYKAKKIIDKNRDIKFLYCSAPQFNSFIVAYLLKKKYKLPIIIEYRDPWSFNPYFKRKTRKISLNEQRLNKKIDLFIEKRILNSADFIITVSPALISFLKNNFPFIKDNRIISIPNGYNLTNQIEKKTRNKDKFVIIFTGNIYGGRSIKPFLKILSNINNDSFFEDFNLEFRIFGNYPPQLKIYVKNLKISNLVHFGGYISRSKALEEVKQSDIALHIGEYVNYPTLAFKIWDYLSHRKKILYLGLKSSITSKFLEENDLGIVLPIDNINQSQKLLENFFIDVKNKIYNTNIDESILHEFTWDKRADFLFNNVIIKLLEKN